MKLKRYAIMVFFMIAFCEVKAQIEFNIKHSLDSILKLIPGERGERFTQVITNNSIALFLYAPRGKDIQQPHNRDEFYIVSKGTGTFFCDNTSARFKQGDLLFAPAGKEHRFENFSDDLIVWVVFYGDEIDSEAIVRKYIQSINEHNVEEIILMQSNDFVLKDSYGNEQRGKDTLRKTWTDYFTLFKDYKIEIESIVKLNNNLVVLGYAGGSIDKSSQKSWRLPISIRANVNGKVISLWQIYADTKIPFDLLNKP